MYMMLNMFCTPISLKTQDHEGEGVSYMQGPLVFR